MFLQHCFQISTPQRWFIAVFRLNSGYWNCTLSWNLNTRRAICISTSFCRPCQRLCAAFKEEVRCVLAFSDPQFLFFHPLSQMSPCFSSCWGRTQGWTIERLKYKGKLGGEIERCEVRRVCSHGGGGIMVHCESLLSNGAFSHQHRPHWVFGARVYWGISDSERKKERERERNIEVEKIERGSAGSIRSKQHLELDWLIDKISSC